MMWQQGLVERTGGLVSEGLVGGEGGIIWEDARDDCLQTPVFDLIIIGNALENRYISDVAAGAGGEDW